MIHFGPNANLSRHLFRYPHENSFGLFPVKRQFPARFPLSCKLGYQYHLAIAEATFNDQSANKAEGRIKTKNPEAFDAASRS